MDSEKKNNLSFVGSIWWKLTSNLDFSSKYTFIDAIVCKYLSWNSVYLDSQFWSSNLEMSDFIMAKIKISLPLWIESFEKEQNKTFDFSSNDLSWPFCNFNGGFWHNKGSNVTVDQFWNSFQIFNLTLVAKIVFVSLRAFQRYQNHENWLRRTISNII